MGMCLQLLQRACSSTAYTAPQLGVCDVQIQQLQWAEMKGLTAHWSVYYIA